LILNLPIFSLFASFQRGLTWFVNSTDFFQEKSVKFMLWL
jgi:hypothetical protein